MNIIEIRNDMASKQVAEDFIDRVGDWLNDCMMSFMDENDLDNLPKDTYDEILEDAYALITEHFKQ